MEKPILKVALIALLGAGAVANAATPPPYQAGRPALKVRPEGDKAIITTVADAMGFVRSAGGGTTTNTINRVQMRGLGKMTVNGTTYPVSRYVYTISLSLKATREDITRGPANKSERLVRVMLDKDVWDEREPGVDGMPATDTALNRKLQLSRTPFGFTRAMLDAPAGSVKVVDPGAKGKVTITFLVEGVTTVATLNAEYRPETITQTVDGNTRVARFTDYKDLSEYGLMFPTRWTETVDGKPYLDLTINDGRVASYAVFPKPIASTTAQR